MSPSDVVAHVRRYPRWYSVAVVWLVGMLLLPIVQADPLDVFRADATPSGAAGLDRPSDLAGAPLGQPATGATGGGDTPSPTDADGSEGATPADDEEPGALDLVPPELLNLIFDSLPPVLVPPLPPEFASLAAAIAPVAAFGCTGLGLASVVIAVVAQTAEGVPVARLLPYLAPVVTACAAFPIPTSYTVCAADEPLVVDLGGVAKTPPILGMGIDQIEALEHALSAAFGQAIPSTAAGLRTQLDCRLVTT